MAIELRRGPIEIIDVDAVMGTQPASTLEEFVAVRLDDIAGTDDRIGGNLDTMASDLNGYAENDPGPDIDEASGVQASLASTPPPDFSGVATAAESEAARLASLAGTLPADPNATTHFTIDSGGDEFEGIDINWDAVTHPVIIGPVSGGGGGGGGDSVDPEEWKAKLTEWVRENFKREPDSGELSDIDAVIARHGTINNELFDELIAENYAPRL